MVFNFGAPKLIPCFWAVTGKAGNLWGNFHHLWDLVSVTFVWPIVTIVIPELVLRTMFLLVFVSIFLWIGLLWCLYQNSTINSPIIHNSQGLRYASIFRKNPSNSIVKVHGSVNLPLPDVPPPPRLGTLEGGKLVHWPTTSPTLLTFPTTTKSVFRPVKGLESTETS